jgi:hypothetical protein
VIWTLSAHVRYYPAPLHADQPAVRRDPRPTQLEVGSPRDAPRRAPYLLIASICTDALADGAPGWLRLVVLWSVWNAMKFIIMGPVSLVPLIRARAKEVVARRLGPRQGDESTVQKIAASRTKTALWQGSRIIHSWDERTTRRT